MEIIFCIMLFCMGAVFGSFFTLAVYRIPLGLDITHERSFCPNCNHRLEFIDLIPILSYLSLRGKCRYCGKPVRIRYLLLEVLSGLVFVAAYFAFQLTFPFFEVKSVCLMIAFVMFYITNAIILGIDKEYIKIDKRVLLFGIITQSIYMLYLYTFENGNLYRYGIYLVIMLILFCLDTIILKKTSKSDYVLQILMLFVYEISFIDNAKIILGMLILNLMIVIIFQLIATKHTINSNTSELTINADVAGQSVLHKKHKSFPYGFCIALSSIASVLIGNLIG